MVHPWAEPEYFVRVDDMGRPAEGLLASDCHQHGVRYGIMACHNKYRLFDCDPSATTGEWLDLVEFYGPALHRPLRPTPPRSPKKTSASSAGWRYSPRRLRNLTSRRPPNALR